VGVVRRRVWAYAPFRKSVVMFTPSLLPEMVIGTEPEYELALEKKCELAEKQRSWSRECHLEGKIKEVSVVVSMEWSS